MEVCRYVQIGRDGKWFCEYLDEYESLWQQRNGIPSITRDCRYVPPLNCPPDAMTESGEPICHT